MSEVKKEKSTRSTIKKPRINKAKDVEVSNSNKSIVEKLNVEDVSQENNIIQEVNQDNSIYKTSETKEDKKISQPYSHSVYPVVKGGVISLTRYLAAYWGEKNIRVNCISPVGVYHEGENETFVKKYSEKVPLRRKANIKEVSSTAVFLASEESSYITGQNIIVDGGWTAW